MAATASVVLSTFAIFNSLNNFIYNVSIYVVRESPSP